MGIEVAVENPLPVMGVAQPVSVYAIGSVVPLLPMLRLPCSAEQATACDEFLVHFTDGDVPLAVVFAVNGPARDGSILKDIVPPTAEPHVFRIVAVTADARSRIGLIVPPPPELTMVNVTCALLV